MTHAKNVTLIHYEERFTISLRIPFLEVTEILRS